MVEGGLKGDEVSDTSVAAVGKTHPEDFRGQSGTGGVGGSMMVLLLKGRG